MNSSFDGRPARVQLDSNHVVLIDPLALDGLSQQLADAGELADAERFSSLRALADHGLRIGVQHLNVAPGTFEVGPNSFESADADDVAGVFETDSGTVVLIDGGALGAVARAFTWDRYDALLQAAAGDNSILAAMNAEIGGPRFAIVSADAETPFSGDGSFRLRTDGLRRVE